MRRIYAQWAYFRRNKSGVSALRHTIFMRLVHILWFMSTALALSGPRPTSEIVAENVRAEAARRGYSQVALAEALGMNQSQVSRRWWGRLLWTFDELDDVAEVLGITVQDLVTDHSVEMQNPRRWIAPRGAAARSKGLEPPTF